MKSKKKVIVPRPRGDYEAGLVEYEAKPGKKTVKVADAPRVHDRPHAKPSSGTEQLGSKSVRHAHQYPGRSYKVSQVENAVEKPTGYVKKIRSTQLGSNQRLGN
jgi:hypothetical protein